MTDILPTETNNATLRVRITEWVMRWWQSPLWWGVVLVMTIALPWWLQSGYLFFTDFIGGPVTRIVWSDPGVAVSGGVGLLALVFPPDVAQKLFVTLLLWLTFACGVAIAKTVSSSRWVQVLAGSALLLNPFVYDRLAFGQMVVLLAMVCFGLGVVTLYRFLLTQRLGWLCVAAVLLAWAVEASPHVVFFMLLCLPLLLIGLYATFGPRAMWLWLVKVLVVIGFIGLLVNIHWFWPLVLGLSQTSRTLTTGITTADFSAFRVFGQHPLLNLLVFRGFWASGAGRYFDVIRYWPYGWVASVGVLLLAAWGLVLAVLDKNKRIFAICGLLVAIVAVILALGVASPALRFITDWLFAHVPGYNGLRETHKWLMLYLFFVVWLVAVAFDWLQQRSWWQKTSITVTVLTLLLVFLQVPLFFWGLYGRVLPTPYPADWKTASTYLERYDGCATTTLVLPWHLYLQLPFTNTVVVNPAKRFFVCPVLSGTNQEFAGKSDATGKPEGVLVPAWLASRGQTNLLSLPQYNFGHILIYKLSAGENLAWVKDLPGLRLELDTPSLQLYRILK
jgi:hypothetical protein